MDLLRAFRNCGPPLGQDEAVDAVRRDGMAMIYGELTRLAPRIADGMRVDVAVAQDSVVVILLRLIKAGPRGVRLQDPADDSGVSAYLCRALRNEIISAIRRTAGHAPPATELPQTSAGAGELEFSLRDRLDRARSRFFAEIVERAAEGAPDWFRDAVADRRSVAEGRASIAGCVAMRFGACDRQTRNLFDQRQHRMLKRLQAVVERELEVDRIEGCALNEVLTALKNRDAIWTMADKAVAR